jgi:PIN domain nuclease of toxin-antitoxin system
LLLDSHTLLWAVDDPTRIGLKAVLELQDGANDLLLSAATIWEIAIKVGLGKLSLSKSYRDWMNQAVTDLGVEILPITVSYADVQATLPNHHRDPFDRLLIAQCQVENVPIVSNDPVFDQYGIVRLW